MLAFLLACTAPDADSGQPDTGCNGDPALCARRLDEVAFPATHNSMSSAEREWIYPNQGYAVPQQLADGVRGLNLDTHAWEDGLWLCHGYCELGSLPLVEGFAEIVDFLDSAPREVLVITLQSGISAEETVAAAEAAGLADHAYTHTTGEPWPTLDTLIADGTRAVIFSSGPAQGWLMHQWEHWIDNPYSALEVSDFSCAEDRGEASTATLFNVNHFLTNPLPTPELAAAANGDGVLWPHVEDCWQETGRFPNQVLVDFYDIGDLFLTTDRLNAH